MIYYPGVPLALLYPTMHYRYAIASDLLCSSEHSLFSACLIVSSSA